MREDDVVLASMRDTFMTLVGEHLRGVLTRDETFETSLVDGISDGFMLSLYGEALNSYENTHRLRCFLQATSRNSFAARLPGYQDFCDGFIREADRIWQVDSDLPFNLTATRESKIAEQEDLLFTIVNDADPSWLKSWSLREAKYDVTFFQLWLLALRIIAIVRNDLFELYNDVEFTMEDATWITGVFAWYNKSLNYNELLLRP